MFGIFKSFSAAHRSAKADAERLLASVIAASRQKAFFVGGQVPDTVTGRFDVLALHAFLVMRVLARDPDLQDINQLFTDRFFRSIDDSIRVLGTSDPGVPRKVRKVAEAFYGRVKAYDAALAAGGFAPLENALLRNVYGGEEPGEGVVHDLAAYFISCMGALAICSAKDMRKGNLKLPVPKLGEKA